MTLTLLSGLQEVGSAVSVDFVGSPSVGLRHASVRAEQLVRAVLNGCVVGYPGPESLRFFPLHMCERV